MIWKAKEQKNYIPIIVEKLKGLNPYKIILFGSYAFDEPKVDSDIDLIVVLDSKKKSKNFAERSENYLRVSRCLRDIERKIPIDLLVYTKPEFDAFIQIGSMFSKKILKEGKEIL